MIFVEVIDMLMIMTIDPMTIVRIAVVVGSMRISEFFVASL